MWSSNFIIFCLLTNFLAIIYLFFYVYNTFFKIILNIIFLFNMSIILSYCNGDFFAAFLLVAELPIAMILIVFFFHNNSIQVDSLYKYKKSTNLFLYLLPIIFFFICINSNNLFFDFNFFSLTDFAFISNKNDFFLFFNLMYFLNSIYVIYFAIIIFFVSFLVIMVYQINKLQSYVKNIKNKNIIFLRKQNMLKQAVFKSKLKFFNKKISK